MLNWILLGIERSLSHVTLQGAADGVTEVAAGQAGCKDLPAAFWLATHGSMGTSL